MPPVASSVGLMVVLPCAVCLATQPLSSGEAFQSPAPTHDGKAVRGSLAAEHLQLLAAIASERGKAEPADFQQPSSPPVVARSPDRATLGATHHGMGGTGGPSAGSGDPRLTVGRDKPRSQAGSRHAIDEVEPVSGTSPHGGAAIKLPRRGRPNLSRDWTGAGRTGGLHSVVTVASSLAVVLGLFLVVAWAMRRAVPGASVTLPSEVVEVLGRATLAGREQVHLLRCGSKLVLVSVSQAGARPLTEITDPDEVSRLAGLCRQSQPGSTTAAFRQVLQQLARPGTHDGAQEGRDV